MADGQSEPEASPRAVVRTKIRVMPWLRSRSFYTSSSTGSEFFPITRWLPAVVIELGGPASVPAPTDFSAPTGEVVRFEVVVVLEEAFDSPEEA